MHRATAAGTSWSFSAQKWFASHIMLHGVLVCCLLFQVSLFMLHSHIIPSFRLHALAQQVYCSIHHVHPILHNSLKVTGRSSHRSFGVKPAQDQPRLPKNRSVTAQDCWCWGRARTISLSRTGLATCAAHARMMSGSTLIVTTSRYSCH